MKGWMTGAMRLLVLSKRMETDDELIYLWESIVSQIPLGQ